MNISLKEKRILKLVHPKFIETHSRPVKAAVIYQKYPRYSITRPDVFQFPWIVIKPEATLFLGKVFYLVPHRTMSKLLKAARERYPDQPFPEQYQSPYRDRHPGALQPPRESETEYETDRSPQDTPDFSTNQTHSPLKSSAGSTPKHVGHGKNHKRGDKVMDANNYSPDESLNESTMNGDRVRKGTISGPIKSCIANKDGDRKFLNLEVTFGSPIIIPASPRQSPSPRDWPDHSHSAHHSLSTLLKTSREGHQEQCPSPSRKGLSSTLKHLLRLDSGEVSGHSSDNKHDYYTNKTYSPTISSAGNTPKHSERIKNHKSRMMNSPDDIAQHAHIGSQNQVNWCSPDVSSSESRASSSGVSTNGGQQIRSCLRKPNSYRKFLNLEVTFGSPIYIVTSPRIMSPSANGSPGGHQIYDDFYH